MRSHHKASKHFFTSSKISVASLEAARSESSSSPWWRMVKGRMGEAATINHKKSNLFQEYFLIDTF